MPSRVSIKTRRRKKRSYKWKSKKNRKYPVGARRAAANVFHSTGFLKDGTIRRHPYSDYQTFVSTSGIHALATYLLTSMVDPDVTNTGNNAQPLFRDEMATYFSEYMVIGAKVTTKFFHTGTPGVPVYCFAWLDTDTTAPTTNQTKRERYGRKVRILLPDKTKSVSITNYYSPSKFHKIAKSALSAEHQLIASVGSNPASYPCYLNFGIQSCDGSTTSGSVSCTTEISFVTKWIKPKNVTGS